MPSGPWEKYQAAQPQTGPWAAYQQPQGGGTGGGGGWSNQDQHTWGQVGREALNNIGPSALNFARALAAPILEPTKFWGGLYTLAKGTAQKLIPGEQGSEYAFDAFKQAMIDRYGSIDAIKNTLATDPVGSLADIAGVFYAGGSALRGVGMIPKLKGAGTAGRVMQGIGGVVDPVNIARQTVALPLRTGLLGGLSQRMFQGVLKPSGTPSKFKDVAKREQLLDTAAKYGIVPSAKAIEQTGDLAGGYVGKVNSIVDDLTARGETIPRDNIAANAQPVLERAAGQMAPTRPTNQAWNELADFTRNAPEQLTPRQVQNMKTVSGAELGRKGAYGVQKPWADEVQKALVNGAKVELERLYPGLKGLNQNAKELLDLRTAISDAASRLDKNNLFSLSNNVLGAGTLGAMAYNPKIGASMLGALGVKAILGHPKVKSRLAIALYNAAKRPNFGQNVGAARVAGGAGAQIAEMINAQHNKTAR